MGSMTSMSEFISLLPIRPSLMRWESTEASVQSMRMTSCSLLISRLNTTTVRLLCTAAYCAIFIAKLDLPMAGREATMIKSLF